LGPNSFNRFQEIRWRYLLGWGDHRITPLEE
jgi:hypothetical protein